MLADTAEGYVLHMGTGNPVQNFQVKIGFCSAQWNFSTQTWDYTIEEIRYATTNELGYYKKFSTEGNDYDMACLLTPEDLMFKINHGESPFYLETWRIPRGYPHLQESLGEQEATWGGIKEMYR